jgi:hypothetical protein
LRGDVDSQRDHEGIKEEHHIEERKFDKIGGRDLADNKI